MAGPLRKLGRKFFDALGINRSVVFHAQFSNAYKQQSKLIKTSQPVIFDIGAFDGRTAVKYHKYFPQAVIHSFEPFPASFEKLKANKVNEKHFIQQLALSSENGSANLYVNKLKASNSLLQVDEYATSVNASMSVEGIVTVEQQTLDDYCSKNGITSIDILKADVQGAELKVLQGAKELLQNKAIHLLYLEVEFSQLYKGQPVFDEISSFLRSYGYVFFAFYNASYLRNGKMIAADVIFING